jgi:hypothetical protein
MVGEKWFRMCKEEIMATFEILFWLFPGDT